MKKWFILDHAPVFSSPERDLAAARVPARNAALSSLLLHIAVLCLLWVCSSYLTTSSSSSTEPLKAPERFVLIYHPPKRLFRPSRVKTALFAPTVRARPPQRPLRLPGPPSIQQAAAILPEDTSIGLASGFPLPQPRTPGQPRLPVPAGFDLSPASSGGGGHRARPVIVTGVFGSMGVTASRQTPRTLAGGAIPGFDVAAGIKVPFSNHPDSTKIKSAPADEPPEITEKPSPGYTQAARAQKVEGVVRVRAQFRADRTVQVVTILHRLGYGLDELAVAAVQHIKFKPGKRNGQEVDCVADLDVEFRLAE